DGELAAVTHEGTRQLVAATGLLPRNVATPHWLQFGLGSFFETPKGAFWPGTGAPSWTYLVKWKYWDDHKKLGDPQDTLQSVISDKLFRQALPSKDHAQWNKPRTMAWGLTYFLMKGRLEKTLRFFKELSELPRDMEFDEDVYVGCFMR